MAITDLKRRELGAATLPSKRSNFVVNAQKIFESAREYGVFVSSLRDWIRQHTGLTTQYEIRFPERGLIKLGSQDEIFREAVVNDESIEVRVLDDVLLWNWGWNQEIERQALSQKKKRKFGLFIPAKRTRSPKAAHLRIRIPHR